MQPSATRNVRNANMSTELGERILSIDLLSGDHLCQECQENALGSTALVAGIQPHPSVTAGQEYTNVAKILS